MSFRTKNARLATALEVLGNTPSFGCDQTTGEVVIIFLNSLVSELEAIDLAWGENWKSWKEKYPVHPLTFMHRCADAWAWLKNDVLYGRYPGVDQLPERCFTTENLKLASVLVAENYYLQRCEREWQRFYFIESAKTVVAQYSKNEPGTPVFYMRSYLDGFEKMRRRIEQTKLDRFRSMRDTCAA